MKKRFMALFTLFAVVSAGRCDDLRVGFTEAYFHGLQQEEALSSMRIWFESIIRQRGHNLESKAIIYDDKEQLATALLNAEVDIVVANTPDTIYLNDLALVDPKFISQRNGRAEESYLLLVRHDRVIARLSDLQHKTVMMQVSTRTSLIRPWFELLMQTDGPGPAPAIIEASKASKVVLPVFFGKADACLVTRNGFNTLAELNPQLGRELIILKESPGYVPSAICLRRHFDSGPANDILRDSQLAADILQGLAELHLDPHGRQVLMLFKIDSLIAYDESRMANVKALMQQLEAAAASGTLTRGNRHE